MTKQDTKAVEQKQPVTYGGAVMHCVYMYILAIRNFVGIIQYSVRFDKLIKCLIDCSFWNINFILMHIFQYNYSKLGL